MAYNEHSLCMLFLEPSNYCKEMHVHCTVILIWMNNKVFKHGFKSTVSELVAKLNEYMSELPCIIIHCSIKNTFNKLCWENSLQILDRGRVKSYLRFKHGQTVIRLSEDKIWEKICFQPHREQPKSTLPAITGHVLYIYRRSDNARQEMKNVQSSWGTLHIWKNRK